VSALNDANSGLAASTVVPLDSPSAGRGITVTDGELARHTDIEVLRNWIEAVRA
jgi:hypothetical protein